MSALVNDANALVAALVDTELEGDAEFALALLALVAGQDVEPAEGSDGTDGRRRIARRVAPDRAVSTVDPNARHTRKSPKNRRDGYRAHVAAGTENSDPAVAEKFLDAEDDTCEWYGDSATVPVIYVARSTTPTAMRP